LGVGLNLLSSLQNTTAMALITLISKVQTRPSLLL
jgi:hypothetical protein